MLIRIAAVAFAGLVAVACSSSSTPSSSTPSCSFEGTIVMPLDSDAAGCAPSLSVTVSVRSDGSATANGQTCTASCIENDQVANLGCTGGDLASMNIEIAGTMKGAANATTKAGCSYVLE